MDKRHGSKNAARIGADPGRFTAVEKWQLIVQVRPIGSITIAQIAAKGRGRDNFNELVQSKGARPGTFTSFSHPLDTISLLLPA
jgi:hypothetical protein